MNGTKGPVTLSAVVEGVIDEAALTRIASHCGCALGVVYGRSGKAWIKQRLAGYNAAAKYGYWLVLVDLDDDFDCAPKLSQNWLPTPEDGMVFRVAVREVESWFLADRTCFAKFLGVTEARLPSNPDTLPDPKSALVELAKSSKHRKIREDVVPRSESGRLVGPAYASAMVEFASKYWDPGHAASRSESLDRCIECLRRLPRT